MAAPQQPQPAPAVSKPSRQEAPWLPLLPKEAGGTLHGLGRYLFAQAIVVQRETISVDVYDQMFTLPRLPGNFKPCNDHRPTPAQVLALTCRVAAYTPLSIIVDIKAVLQAVNKTVRDALLLGYVPLPSHVEAHLARVCAAGCGAQCVATEGPGGGVTGMRNNRIWYCNLACRNEVSTHTWLGHNQAHTLGHTQTPQRRHTPLDTRRKHSAGRRLMMPHCAQLRN